MLSVSQASKTSPVLRLDVYDYDAVSRNDFLGQKIFYEIDLLRSVLIVRIRSDFQWALPACLPSPCSFPNGMRAMDAARSDGSNNILTLMKVSMSFCMFSS